MPLPDNPAAAAMSWPPPAVAGAQGKLGEWATWWSNDPDALAARYGINAAAPRNRPSQSRGGVVGTVARWFWGSPTAVGQSRAKLHVPIASDIATASADLLFSEAAKVSPPEGATGEQTTRLEQILDGLAWDSLMPEQAESAAALGGVYHRVTWDKALADHPLVDIVHADCAWPEFGAGGRLRACTFWDVAAKNDNRVLRILERHELGSIEFGLYEGTVDKLGTRVDFGALDALGLARPNLADSEDGATLVTGPNVPLTATYVPNLRPVRGEWRTDPVLSNLGRSDLDGIEPLLDAADETMTSWMRDLRLGKGRIIVPEWMLQNSNREGGGSFFNIDQEAFVALNAPLDPDKGVGQQVEAQQFELRTQQHADTLAGILGLAFRGAGYSQQTFGIVGESEGMATATEVTARESRSNRTREKKSRYMVDALPRTLAAVFAVDEVHFGRAAAGSGFRPTVAFPDLARDPEAEGRAVQTLRAAQVLSIYSGVKRINPEWTEQELADEVQRIYDDEKALTPALPDLGAMPGDPQNPDGPPLGDAAPVG